MKIANKIQDWIFPHYNKSGSNIKQISVESSHSVSHFIRMYTHAHTCKHTHTHTLRLPWNLDEGAKLCKLGPLSQQVDEDNWIRCVWSLRPTDQSSGTSGHSYTHGMRAHTHTYARTRKWEHHVKEPQKLQLGWLKEPDILSLTSRCRATGSGSLHQAASEKQADLGAQTRFFP